MQARSRPLARVSRTVAAAPAGLLRATAVRTVHADGAAGASARRSSGFGVVIAGGAVAASAAVLVAGGLPTTRGAEHTPEAVPEAASMGMDTPEVARVMQKRAQITKIESNAVVFSEYHVNSVAANKNLEDRFATSIVSTADFGNHGLFGVYDGHSGSAAADWVQDHLIDYIRYSMLMVRNGTASDGEAASFVAPAGSVPDANGNGPDGVNTNDGSGADGVPADLVTTLDGPHRAVEYAIRRAFLQCDRVFLQTALADPETQKAGLSGAPAVMAYITGRHLYVAGSGDCRAILIRRNPDTGAVSAEALSIDHHGRVPSEVNRIRSAHKDEWDAIFRGRVKGRLQPTRGFGDGVYKDAAFNQLHRNPIASKYTPPYTTADADVIHTELVGDEECLVLATDGLWDFFENDQVASLVEHALTHNKQPDCDANDVNLSTALIGAVLFKAALPLREYSSHPIEFLFSLAARIRRRVYDDTTVMVVRFDRDRIAKMEPDNHRETLLAAGTEDETTEGIAAAVAAHCR